MIKLHEIERQLRHIGATFSIWTYPEVRELQHILMPGEEIKAFVSGRYSGGFAVICATDLRILLVDKKIMYLTVEDIRYDMIVEVDYSYRLLEATTSIITPTNTLVFMSYKKYPLRQATNFIQQRVMELRHVANGQAYTAATPAVTHMESGYSPLPVAKNIPLVATHAEPNKPFIPRLPFKRMMNPYTQTPLVNRRRISRYYPS
jgi:hypothetical protein